MHGLSSNLKLNHSPLVQFRIFQPSSTVLLKFQLPSTVSLNKRSWIWWNNDQVHFKQICNVIQTRAAGLDVSQELGKDDSAVEADQLVNAIEDYISYVRERLITIGNGRISVSPYDTAWAALIKDINGQDRPEFPSTLEWIAQNQLSDGSWGDEHYFIPSDRLVNTLACVVALRSWNLHPDKSEKGVSFIKENVNQLENENAEHTICGFEVVFPALLQRARKLGIDGLPYDAAVIREIYSSRDMKMKRIPKELMHTVPTSLLFSLEGFEDLDWIMLLKLQAKNGSFLTSPSSTAYAFMESKDDKCLKFINDIVQEFNGGVPHSYPADIFARLWAVDRLQRLGISRYFESEINGCLNYVHRYWSDKGVFSAREVGFSDLDDTSMGFRLLRLQGYEVNPNVFKHFKMENKFSCYAGQIIESPSPIYSLYRASQLLFPGEKILEEAMDFSYKFLKQRLIPGNQLIDKWVISKKLHDEIQNGMEIPWNASLPRIEARFYIEHYGGADEIWNGKTWNRMYDISNNEYLELAKLDFNRCQAQHQIEWTSILEWYDIYNVEEFGISRKDLLLAFFLATAIIFEPERSKERIVWAKSQIIAKMITSFFNEETTSQDQKVALLSGFTKNINGLGRTNSGKREQGLVTIMLDALHQFLEGFEGKISHRLKNVWSEWLTKLHQGMANCQEDGELLATTVNICAGYVTKKEILSQPEYKAMAKLTNKICHRLCETKIKKVNRMDHWSIKDGDIEQDMQDLVRLVLDEYGGIDRNIKQTFFAVAKTYYYGAYTAAENIEIHISKVLFEPVA